MAGLRLRVVDEISSLLQCKTFTMCSPEVQLQRKSMKELRQDDQRESRVIVAGGECEEK